MCKGKVFGIILLTLIIGLMGCSGGKPIVEQRADLTGKVELQSFPEEVFNFYYKDGYFISKVILDDQESTITTFDGRFSFKNVTVGQHTLELKNSMYKSEKVTVNVSKDGTFVTLTGTVDSIELYSSIQDDETIFLQIGVKKYFEGANQVRIGKTDYITIINWNGATTIDGTTNEYVISDIWGYEGMFDFYVNVFEWEPGESFTLEYTFYNDETELEKVAKEFDLPMVQLKDIDMNEPGRPVLNWESFSVSGDLLVSYTAIINQPTQWGSKIRLYIETPETTHKVVNKLEPGQYFFQVKAKIYDETGLFLAEYCSERMSFTLDYEE